MASTPASLRGSASSGALLLPKAPRQKRENAGQVWDDQSVTDDVAFTPSPRQRTSSNTSGALLLPKTPRQTQENAAHSPVSLWEEPCVTGDLDDYLPHLGLLSARDQCSLAAALVAQQRADEGLNILHNIINGYDASQHTDSDGWFADALLNAGIALSAQRKNNVMTYRCLFVSHLSQEAIDFFVRASSEYAQAEDLNGYVLAEANTVNCLCLLQDFGAAHSRINNTLTSLGEECQNVDSHLLLRFRSLAAVAAYNAGQVDEGIVQLQAAIELCEEDTLLAGLCQNMGAYYNTAGNSCCLPRPAAVPPQPCYYPLPPALPKHTTGWPLTRTGEFEMGAAYHARALEIYQSRGDSHHLAEVGDNYGYAEVRHFSGCPYDLWT